MKTNVCKFLALTVGLLFSITLGAQEEEVEGRMQERFSELAKRLELEPDQVEPFRAALRETRAQRAQILATHGVEAGAGKCANLKAMRAARPELKEAKRAGEMRLAGILSEEQMREYEALRDELAQEGKQRLKDREGKSPVRAANGNAVVD